jgi:hypothetical protein
MNGLVASVVPLDPFDLAHCEADGLAQPSSMVGIRRRFQMLELTSGGAGAMAQCRLPRVRRPEIDQVAAHRTEGIHLFFCLGSRDRA